MPRRLHGTTGAVYKASDEAGGAVAVKVLSPAVLEVPGVFERFAREAETGRTVGLPKWPPSSVPPFRVAPACG